VTFSFYSRGNIYEQIFSAALDLPNGRQAFVSFFQGKENKPAAGDREKSIKNISTMN
jgi:hypothetical protein